MSSKQGKILGIDLGDRWVGLAISDSARLLARPLTTVAAPELRSFLTDLVQREVISTVVVGHPQTMGGGKSQQTLSVETWFQHLQKAFPEQQWILWDERLSSQRAAQSGKTTTRAAKLRQHAVAAAFILATRSRTYHWCMNLLFTHHWSIVGHRCHLLFSCSMIT